MLIDTEDVVDSIVARLRHLGATNTAIRERLLYVRPTDPFGGSAVDYLKRLVVHHHVSLVVIDSIGECFGLDGINEDKDSEVGPWMRRVARALADAGPAVLLVDHSTKAGDNPLHPSGSKRKRAAIGGASFLVTAIKPLTREHGGRLRLTCAKDRHGTYQRGVEVAELVMTETSVELYANDNATADASPDLVVAARAAVAAVKTEGRPMTLRTVTAAMKIKASAELKRAGVDLAVGRAALHEEPGPNRARMFTYVSELPDLP
jgi:hypothetical protein